MKGNEEALNGNEEALRGKEEALVCDGFTKRWPWDIKDYGTELEGDEKAPNNVKRRW